MNQLRIFILLLGILISPYLSAIPEQQKLSQLQSLFNKNIPGTIALPTDTVIKWVDEIEPFLLSNNLQTEYFETELLAINAFCFRGDIILAINRVHKMVDDAVEQGSALGFALANVGIGDTYVYSNMPTEAINSYSEALQNLEQLPQTVKHQKITLLKLIHASMYQDNIENFAGYITKLNELFSDNPEHDSLWPTALLYNAYFHIKNHEPEKALNYLEQAKSYIDKETASVRTATLYYISSNYYKGINNLQAALNELNKLPLTYVRKLDSNRYTKLEVAKAEIYALMEKDHDAALLYQRIVNRKDSLYAKSYARQVNALRAMYQINQIEKDNQVQKSREISLFLIISLAILFLGVLLAFYIIRSTKLLRKSKEQLESAKTKAESSMKTKSMILSNMSHEIRTPLNALTGFSAILTESMIDDETRQQCNDIIQQNSELLLKLIDDVIDLSSLEFGKMQFTFKDQDAVKLCRNVTDTVQKVKQTQADILFKTELDSLVLHTDEARIQQVLFNLMINATKFTTQGQIVLELSLTNPDKALFSVTDTGCGIAPEKQDKIFERFEKLDERAQGTGLGLSICQLIINHVGGEIWIDPDYTGGSKFCFTHPIQKQ